MLRTIVFSGLIALGVLAIPPAQAQMVREHDVKALRSFHGAATKIGRRRQVRGDLRRVGGLRCWRRLREQQESERSRLVDPAPAFEVEFVASDGTTIALVYLEAADIPVTAREIANVRHVA